MKVLVLNDSESEFLVIATQYENSDVFHAHRYLQFLQQIEEQDWDIVYLDDDLSSTAEPDSWFDGNGFKKLYDGVHAARAIATLAEIGKNPAKRVIISSSSNAADKMSQILSAAGVNVAKRT
jgi:hypothetical protein